MTFNYTKLVVVFLLSSVLSSPLIARDTVVGLSAYQSSDALQGEVEQVIAHLTKTMKPGDQARFFDASGVKLVATFNAPTGNGAGNPRVMLNANKRALGELKHFIDGVEPVPGRLNHINLPSFLRAIRSNYPAGEGGADLIVLGSPITDDPQAPSSSMLHGRIANDGHVVANVGQSIYATNGLSGSLAGYDFYFGVTGEPWKVSTEQAYYLERFWAISAEGHGASLVYFGDDLRTVFGLAGREVPDRKHAEPVVVTDKLEMQQFASDEGGVADIYTQPLEIAPPAEPIWRAANNVRFGITWDVPQVDLDLYVRPTPSAPVIYFNQAQTDEGQLYKDYTSSPNGFETVSLNGVVDLSAVRLALNFYGGDVPAGKVSGEIRIAIGDEVWAKPFIIRASSGNRGAGAETVIREGTAANDAWIIVDPVAVVTGE